MKSKKERRGFKSAKGHMGQLEEEKQKKNVEIVFISGTKQLKEDNLNADFQSIMYSLVSASQGFFFMDYMGIKAKH